MRLALLAVALLGLVTGCPKRPAPTRSQDVRSWADLQAGWKARIEQGNGSADARAAFDRAMLELSSSETGSRRRMHRELTACLEAAKKEADDWGFYVCAIADADHVADSRDRPEARLALEDVDSRNVFQGVRGHILGSLAELDRVDCRHERALANAKLAVEILEGDLGETHVELAPALSTLARLQNRRGEWLIARANADRVLELKKRKFGEGSADYCSALELRASIYRTTSGFRGLLRAVELAEEADGVESLRASRQRIKLAAYRIEDRSLFSEREFSLTPAAIAAALVPGIPRRIRLHAACNPEGAVAPCAPLPGAGRSSPARVRSPGERERQER